MAVGNPITELSGPGDFVPVTRTLTINGVTYDLSANRSWTVSTGGGGTVTSVGLTMPTGFAVANSPVTTAGTLAVTFASGYALPTTAKQTQWDSAYSFTSGFPTGTAQQLLRYNTLGTALEFFTPSFLTPVDIIATTPLVWNSTTKKMSIPAATNSVNGYLTSADWLTFSSKQPAITLTTTGNNGAASLIGATLNVPDYTLVGLGGMANPFSAAIGQIIYSNSAGAPLSLSGNTTTTKLFLSQTGDGTNSDAPFWSTISVSNVVGAIGLTALSASSPLSYNNSTGAFSIQVATASQNGYLSSSDWVAFSSKQGAITLTTTGNSGSSTLIGNTLNVPTYTLAGLGGMTNPFSALGQMLYSNAIGAPLTVAPNTTTTKKYLSMTGDGTSGDAPFWDTITASGLGAVPTSRTLTINGTSFDLSANRSWSVGTVTSVGLSTSTTGVTIGSTPITSSGSITINIATASASSNGLLTSTDWSYFDAKMGNPFSQLGDILYSNAIGVPTRRSPNVSTTKMFLSQTGDGTTSAAPVWEAITAASLGVIPASRTLTINGTSYDLSADRSWSVGTVTSVGLSTSTTGVTIGSTPVTSSGTITVNIATASGSSAGLLSASDWSAFNAKLGNPFSALGQMIYSNAGGAPLTVAPNTTTTRKYLSMLGDGTSGAAPTWETVTGFLTGSGTTGTLLKFTGTGTVGDSLVSESGSSVYIGNGGSASEYAIQVGNGRSGNGYAYIDLIGDTTYTDYGLRLIRNNGGANTTSVIEHRGTGDFIFKTVDAAPFKIQTGSTDRMAMASSGQLRLHAYTSTTSFTGTAVGLLAYDAFGQVITQANLPQSGNYTPTLTGVANVNATTAYNCQYIRIGNVVSVSGRLEVDAATASALTIVSLQLPYNTTFANAHQCNGVLTAEDNICGIILGVGTAADLRFTPPNTGSFNYFFTLHFEII